MAEMKCWYCKGKGVVSSFVPPKACEDCGGSGVIELFVGYGAHESLHSDSNSFVVEEVSGNKVKVRYDEAKLLNGPKSGEPDALHFSPGGFCGHFSGRPRYELSPGKSVAWFSKRNDGYYRKVGVAKSRSHFGVMKPGRHYYYDMNF